MVPNLNKTWCVVTLHWSSSKQVLKLLRGAFLRILYSFCLHSVCILSAFCLYSVCILTWHLLFKHLPAYIPFIKRICSLLGGGVWRQNTSGIGKGCFESKLHDCLRWPELRTVAETQEKRVVEHPLVVLQPPVCRHLASKCRVKCHAVICLCTSRPILAHTLCTSSLTYILYIGLYITYIIRHNTYITLYTSSLFCIPLWYIQRNHMHIFMSWHVEAHWSTSSLGLSRSSS